MSQTMRWLVGLGLVVTLCGMVMVGKQGTVKAIGAQTAPPMVMKKAKGVTDASGVMYFSHDETADALKESLVVDDEVPKKNYRVAVYHRDKGGEVEIHKKDTDVFYIVEGSATFVTGGTITGGKETAPDEIRVATMQGGVERRLSKGDVIIVPANVTHWYKEVQQPITYFGVKVQ
jgi:quercetin dioxygenase-like cupin family protein